MITEKICLVEFHRHDLKIQTFAELIGALLTAFTEMGHDVRYRQDKIDPSALNIIFGCHRLFKSSENVIAFPKNCIFFNLEPLYEESEHLPHLRYLDLLAQSVVIDYSASNCNLLHQGGNRKVYRFPFGYASLTPFRFPAKRRHLFFYGVPSDRRKKILDSLLKSHVELFWVAGYWGFERDYEIATARAVINISQQDYSILEIYRLWHSLCLGAAVISEKGIDPVLVDEWKDYVCFVDNLNNLSPETLASIPDASIYKTQTSFHSEAVKLKNWIQEVFR